MPVFERSRLPTALGCKFVRNGDFGASPSLRQLSGKQGVLPAHERYAVLGPMTMSALGSFATGSAKTTSTNVRFPSNTDRKFLALGFVAMGRRRACEQLQQGGHLFDDLVGAGDERRRHFKADFFCRFQIDDELEPGRLLDRQLGRFRSLQDLRYITGCNRHHFGLMGTVGDETPAWRPSLKEWRTGSRSLRVSSAKSFA